LLTRVKQFLGEQSTLVLATRGKEGNPQTAPLFYVSNQDLKLYFLSKPDSDHAKNIFKDPNVAVSIFFETANWQEIRGLQLEGTAAMIISTDERKAAMALFSSKFPFVVDMAARVSSSEWYGVSPNWLRWIDNRRRFGERREILFGEVIKEEIRP